MLRRSTYTVAKAALRINPPNGEVGVRTHENQAIILGIKAGKPLETPAVFGLQPFRPHVLAVPNHLDATLFFEKRAKIYDFYYFFKKDYLFDKLEFT